jgi:hypothetical protein
VTSPQQPHTPRAKVDRRARPDRRAPRLLDPESGSLYVHVQAENGVAHRTLVLSPFHVRLLRALMSPLGAVLLLAVGGSWLYFATQSVRVPLLTQRVASLQVERSRLDTLEVRLRDLQVRYDQVQRMLGVPAADSMRTGAGQGTAPRTP